MSLRLFLICCLLCTVAPGRANDAKRRHLHGPIEYLQLNLPQSAQDERLLLAARRELAAGAYSAAFDALQQVFAQQHDTFTTISHSRDSRSIYESAVALLQDSPATIRQQWVEHQQSAADTALQKALASGSPAQLRKVARQYPFTAAAMRSIQLQAALADSRGHQQLARHLRNHLNQQIPWLPGSVRRMIPSASGRSMIADEHRDDPIDSQTVASAATLPPGTDVLWEYSEPVWDHPELAAAMGGLQLPENWSVLARNAWQAELAGDQILFRSPTAISAFDKVSGKRHWRLPTDTVHRDYRIGTAELQTESVRRPVHELLQMTDYSALSVHQNSVYFLDHFRRLVDRSSVGPRQRLRRAPLLADPMIDDWHKGSAGRLVAVSLTSPPAVRWTAGDSDEFDYQFDFSSGQADAVSSATVAEGFAGHSFLGSPRAVEGQLFVLTSDREQIWLNCLNDADGTLLWRNPLMYNDAQAGRRSRYIAVAEPEPGASVCAIWQDVVLSVLQSGIVVANDIHSGHLRWAANLRGPAETEFASAAAADADFIRAAGTVHRPLLAGGHLLVMTSESHMLTCLDVATGTIRWQVPRRLNHDGLLEGSVDNCVLALRQGRVILSGSRHVRAVRLKDGRPLWATLVQHQTGLPACDGDMCLVPQVDGSIVRIDLTTGALQDSPGTAGTVGSSGVGSLSVDDDVYCLSTPLTISVHRRMPSADPPEPLLQSAEVQIWNGQRDAARTQLRAVVQRSQNGPAPEMLAELLLQQVHEGAGGSGAAGTHQAIIDELNQLPLTNEQRWRLHVYRGLFPEALDTDDALGAPPLVAIDRGWRVRADVALLSESVTRLQGERQSSVAKLLRSKRTAVELLTLLGERPEFPSLLQSALDRHEQSDDAAGEVLLLAAQLFGDQEIQQQAEQRLMRLRETHRQRLSPAPQPSQPDPVDQPGPNRVVPSETEVQEQLALTTGSRFAEIIAGVRTSVETPDWYPRQLFLVNRNLFTVSADTGAVSVPIPMPRIVQPEPGPDVVGRPSVIPVVQSDQVGAVSLLAGEKPRLLWYRKIDRRPSDLSQVEIGPCGPGYMIVGCETRLICFHPLTGRTLWDRVLSIHDQPANVYQKHQRFLGDHQVIGIMGAGRQWCELFRTCDGSRLESVAVNIPPDQTPMIYGGRILYQQNDRLILLELSTQRDLLADQPAVQVSGRSYAELLDNGRAVVLTSDHSLLLLNMQTGRIEFQQDLRSRLPEQQPSGLTAFQRDGKLFVVVRDWGSPGSEYTATSRSGQTRIESGTLFCINPTQNQVLWHMRARPSAWPRIAGDDTDLLVSWSMRYPARQLWQRRIPGAGEAQDEFAHARSLTLQLIDGRTGTVLVDREGLSPMEPLRVVHDAAQRQFRVYTEKSVVQISYANRP